MTTPAGSAGPPGLVFDIREFTLHDGPGLRTTVFLKGCPLDCSWCHNPEGKSCQPQVMKSGTTGRLAGRAYTAQELACRLNKQAPIFHLNQGGVTFSGGEPLAQTEFLLATIAQLQDIHIVLDTSGAGSRHDFARLVEHCDLVYFDLKLMDPLRFRQFTGGNLQVILDNLQQLAHSGKPFVIRVPLVPGVTDTDANLSAIAQTAAGLPGLERVDLLPYNRLAGAKYAAAGLKFEPGYDENAAPNLSPDAFAALGIPWRIT